VLSIFFDTMPSAPKPARMGEHDRAVLGDVFIEQDAGLGIAQQPCQRVLAVEEPTIAHILAVMLDEIVARSRAFQSFTSRL
jgi:hypothetical protein